MNAIGLYIHIPFCDQKCPYCDFFSISDENEYDRYTDNLIKIIDDYSSKYKRDIATIYFGGGTPSILKADRLAMILNTVKNKFHVLDDAEITLEVNPCSSKDLDFFKLRQAGFNRVSIGLQSALDSELKTLGRRHSSSDAKETVNSAQNAGIDNISLDLMICVPGQTKSSLTKSIEFCKDCNVTHVSSYILKFEKNTPFYKRKNELDVFSDDEQAKLYLHTVNELESHGYYQYEISNFSKEGFEGKHNLKYWRDEEYLGLGPSAHSYIDGKRFYYNRDINDFYSNIIVFDDNGGDIYEYIMLALRLKEGLNLKSLFNRYNYTVSESFLKRVNKLVDEGLVTFNNETVSLTKEGFLVSNMIINYLNNEI